MNSSMKEFLCPIRFTSRKRPKPPLKSDCTVRRLVTLFSPFNWKSKYSISERPAGIITEEITARFLFQYKKVGVVLVTVSTAERTRIKIKVCISG